MFLDERHQKVEFSGSLERLDKLTILVQIQRRVSLHVVC